MAQTLRYFNDVLALLADNTGGNISAVDVRDSLASLFQGGGLVSSDTPIVLPMTNGAWTAINPLLVAPYVGAGLWRADGNNNLTPDYAQLPDTVVPAGFQKAASWLVQMHLVKATSGTDSYVASLTRNGVNMGQAVPIYFDTSEAQSVDISWLSVEALDDGAAYGVSLYADGTDDDVTLDYFTMTVFDNQLRSGA